MFISLNTREYKSLTLIWNQYCFRMLTALTAREINQSGKGHQANVQGALKDIKKTLNALNQWKCFKIRISWVYKI